MPPRLLYKVKGYKKIKKNFTKYPDKMQKNYLLSEGELYRNLKKL